MGEEAQVAAHSEVFLCLRPVVGTGVFGGAGKAMGRLSLSPRSILC